MLTAKQTKFINEVSEGSSQSSAYRKAYDTSRMTPKTVWEESSRLRKHPKVSARIVELEAEKEARQRVQALSREDRILNELEDIAFGSTNAMARLRALELLGKTVGLFKPKEVTEQTRTAYEIKSAIELKLAALIE
jgi:hypothetical protein